jgi:hypothetical protein
LFLGKDTTTGQGLRQAVGRYRIVTLIRPRYADGLLARSEVGRSGRILANIASQARGAGAGQTQPQDAAERIYAGSGWSMTAPRPSRRRPAPASLTSWRARRSASG